jgi:solute carrier family 45 protein 1/2/4
MSPLDDDDWQGEQQTEETKSSWFLFLLTFGGLGLQIGWSVETSNGSVSHLYLSYRVGVHACIHIFLTMGLRTLGARTRYELLYRVRLS